MAELDEPEFCRLKHRRSNSKQPVEAVPAAASVVQDVASEWLLGHHGNQVAAFIKHFFIAALNSTAGVAAVFVW